MEIITRNLRSVDGVQEATTGDGEVPITPLLSLELSTPPRSPEGFALRLPNGARLSLPPKAFAGCALEEAYVLRLLGHGIGSYGTLEVVKNDLKNKRKTVSVDEDVLLTTKNRLSVRAITVSVRDIVPEEKNFLIYVFICDSKGGVLADRQTEIRQFSLPGKTHTWKHASGMITTGFRGLGLAGVLEDFHVLALQREADKGIEVHWRVSNTNMNILSGLRTRLGGSPWAVQELVAAQREQDRWQALYGSKGRLGIVDNSRVFSPRKSFPESWST